MQCRGVFGDACDSDVVVLGNTCEVTASIEIDCEIPPDRHSFVQLSL